MRRIGRLVANFLILSLLLGFGMPGQVRAETTSHPFTDIRAIPQESAIAALYKLGVVGGMTADTYGPAGTVTRAQMATFIVRALGRSSQADQLKTAPLDFSDVPENHWARGTIALASRLNIIKGDAGRFNPNDPVNYAQVATMLVRALGYENQVIGGYPSGYVITANDLGLLKNVSFDLFANVNRAEAAVFLYNMVYRAAQAGSELTLSQTQFKKAETLAFDQLPTYAAPGQQILLNAIAKDLVGKAIVDMAVTFSVTSGSGQINGRTFTLGTGGPVTIRAAYSDLTATATVTPVSDLAVSPATFQANKGGTVQLSATAMINGQRIPVQPTWRVVQGPATVDDKGLVTVTDYGAVSVQASLGNFAATSTGQAVGKVTITQKPSYLIPGQTAGLSARAEDAQGRPISVPIVWSATGATIDSATGTLTNIRGSQVLVTATAAGIKDEATIPVLQSLQITPAIETILIGKTVIFEAQGVDAAGNLYPVEAQWSRSNAQVGIIGSEGDFVGIASGQVIVTGSLGSLRGNRSIRVGGQPTQLSISALNGSLPSGIGASTTLTVKLLDSTGAVSPVDDQPILLTLTESARGTLSRTVALTRQGEAQVTYTAGAISGTDTISVQAPGTILTNQSLTISSYAQTPHHIDLSATPNPLLVGGSTAVITATLKDTNGFRAVSAQTLHVPLSVSGTGGSLVGMSITIPAGQSSGTMTFLSNSQAGSVSVGGTSTYPVNSTTITTVNAGPAAKAEIRPIAGTTPVTGLTNLTVKVDVTDSGGVVRAADSSSQVELTVEFPSGTPGDLTKTYTATAEAGTATFQVPGYAVGTARLAARLVGLDASTDTATAEFVPGLYSSLRLSTQPSSLLADGSSTGTIIAEVVDRDGSLLPNISTTVTFRKLVDGGATTEVSSPSVPTVGGRAILSVRSTRVTGTDIWFASSPGLDTQNLATVQTTSSSGDVYTLRSTGSTVFTVGSTGTLVIQMVDQQGRVVTADNGRIITASYNIPGVTITQTAVTQNGAATFAVLGMQAGTGLVTFTEPGLPVPSVQVPITFGAGGTAYSLFASGPATAQIGTPVTLWVRVMDNQGNIMTGDNGRTISASITGRGSFATTQVTTAGGVAAFTLTGISTGTASITFTAPGLPQATATLSITFTN